MGIKKKLLEIFKQVESDFCKVDVSISVLKKSKEEVLDKNVERALARAYLQLGESFQPCKTNGCKFNPQDQGKSACNNPNPAPELEDLELGIVEEGHPLWHLYCMRFARTAYDMPARGSAQATYNFFDKKGEINKDTKISIGAFVFWRWKKYGHVGIHLGDKKIIHTGLSSREKKKGIRIETLEEIMGKLSEKNYLGWTLPKR